MDNLLIDIEPKMQKCIERLEHEFGKIQTGRANANMLEGINVTVYGAPTPINQMAVINIPEARMLTIKPFDRSNVKALEDALQKADLGINPSSDGEMIRLQIPALTEDRRKDLVKESKKLTETAKVAVRQVRQDYMQKAKKDAENNDQEKWLETEIQKYTDKYIKLVDETFNAKEKDLMTV